MPALSRWCVRAALGYLVVGMGVGSWMLIQRALGTGPHGHWPTLHAHILLIGFLLLMVMGVAFWMFPRRRGQRSGNTAGWSAFALMNGGVVLRVATEPAVVEGSRGAWAVGLGTAAAMPTLGAGAFAVAILPRVRAAMAPAEAKRLREEAQARRRDEPTRARDER